MERRSNKDLYYLDLIKEEQNKIGQGFFVLNWFDQEIHLAEGMNHSCYHCPQQKIPLDSDLHNTPHKIEQRSQMLNGERPDECSYCWEVEDLGLVSDRQTLAAQFFQDSKNVVKEAVNIGLDYAYPRYLELSFTNKCQMSCSYCTPAKSSMWQKEIEEYGEYNLEDNSSKSQYVSRTDIIPTEDNPYIQKFWKWLPEAYEHLFVLRLTGGEPLLDKNTYKLLQYVKDNPNPKLSFQSNSNLMISEKRVQRYLDLVSDIPNNKLYVSIDNWGKRAEWIRNGLDISHFEKNVLRVLEAGVDVGFMVTYCFLSIHGFEDLLTRIAFWKRRFPGQVTIDTPHMVQPEHLTAMIADDMSISIMEEQLNYMRKLMLPDMFTQGEYEKFKRTIKWISNNRYTGEKLHMHRRDFKRFVQEHDKRRNTSFLYSFPELKGFYNGIESTST